MPTVRCLLPSFLLPVAAALSAATLQVTSTGDTVANDGACSLREAVSSANTQTASGAAAGECGVGQSPPFDRIELPPGSYRLQRGGAAEDNNVSGDLDIRRGGLTIVGAGADLTEIRGDRNQRVLDIGAGLPAPGGDPVLLAGLTLRNGSDSEGGGVRTAPGWALIVDGCVLANNTAGRGGGIAAAGALILQASTLHANAATDPGSGAGGGLYYAGATPAQLRNVTFNANESATDGAAALFAGPARLNNVTAAANVSDADANGSGDAAILAQATVQLSNSLLAANIDFSLLIGGNFTPDCAGSPGALQSLDHNLIGNLGVSCTVAALPADQFGTAAAPLNPRLLPLGAYGGRTETQLPEAVSPAVDRGAPNGADAPCELVDQRGVVRPLGAYCDIGAVESDDRIFADGLELG